MSAVPSILVADPSRRVTSALVGAAEALERRGGLSFEIAALDTADIGRPVPKRVEMIVVAQGAEDCACFASTVESAASAPGQSAAVIAMPATGTTRMNGDWLPPYFGLDVMLWVLRGARAVVSAEFAGSPAVLRRLVEAVSELRGRAGVVIGEEPVKLLDHLDSEVRDVWFDIEDDRVCWRAAFALSYAAPLPTQLNEWKDVAPYLAEMVPWFTYNTEDVRKALGRLKVAWECEGGRFRHRIATVALSRGYSRSLSQPGRDVEDLFDCAMGLDVSGRRRLSGGGDEWDEVVLRLDEAP